MNIHEVGGWHPLLTAVHPLAPPALHAPITVGRRGISVGLSLAPGLEGLGGVLVTIVGQCQCLAACWDS